MSYIPSYKKGDWKAVCQRCGRYFKGSELRRTWDGLYVCEEDWEEKHPQLYVTGVRDDQRAPFVLADTHEEPASYEYNTKVKLSSDDLRQVANIPTTQIAGDRVFWTNENTVIYSNGDSWFYGNGTQVNIAPPSPPFAEGWYLIPVDQDNFDRPDEVPIGPPWQSFATSEMHIIDSNAVFTKAGSPAGDEYYYTTSNSYDANQFITFELLTDKQDDELILGFFANITTPGNYAYVQVLANRTIGEGKNVAITCKTFGGLPATECFFQDDLVRPLTLSIGYFNGNYRFFKGANYDANTEFGSTQYRAIDVSGRDVYRPIVFNSVNNLTLGSVTMGNVVYLTEAP